MAHGISIQMKTIDMARRWRKQEPRETRERDRALAGKKRIKARRAAHGE